MTYVNQSAQTSPLAGESAELVDWAQPLRHVGRRVTRQRLCVLEAAQRHPHATAEEIHRDTLSELPQFSLQSAYVVLNDLVESGLLRRIDLPGHPARFETEIADNHHHAVCISCGRVEDVACAVGHAPCLTPPDGLKMNILVADVLFRGICADCAARGENNHSEKPQHEGDSDDY